MGPMRFSSLPPVFMEFEDVQASWVASKTEKCLPQYKDRLGKKKESGVSIVSRIGWFFLFKFFKVENNSLELTRIFKESFKDQR